MIIRAMPLGPLQANCFLVGCEQTRQAAVIDPGGDVDRILTAIEKEKLTLSTIINTHGHFDHVGGNKALKGATNAELLIHELDAPMLAVLVQSAAAWGMPAEESPSPDRLLKEGDVVEIGEIKLEVIHTPGHSPGGICLHAKAQKVLFTGDTLFAGGIGRSDLPGGDHNTLISSIQTKLFKLDEQTAVYNGHMEPTTIGQEKRYNPFCRVG